MLHPKLIYTGEYTIRTYEIDQMRRVTIGSLIKLMQEAAMQNVMELGLSVWDLEVQRISWVVLRMDIDFFRLPALGETISVTTHGAGFDKLFAYRDYRVRDQQGNAVAQASSTWLLMDIESRKMARIPDYISALETPPAEECLPRPTAKIPKWEGEALRQEFFRVHWHDLDFNGHLNNIYYMQWMLELMDGEFLRNGKLRRLEIQFKNECQWNDEVIGSIQNLGNGSFLHLLSRRSDGKEMAMARTYWNL